MEVNENFNNLQSLKKNLKSWNRLGAMRNL